MGLIFAVVGHMVGREEVLYFSEEKLQQDEQNRLEWEREHRKQETQKVEERHLKKLEREREKQRNEDHKHAN